MNTTVDAGLYMRLSVEDESNNESTSIQTQRAMLTDYCREKGFRIVDYYVDDGETGTNFERPEFQRMLRDIEAGKINTVICKDGFAELYRHMKAVPIPDMDGVIVLT